MKTFLKITFVAMIAVTVSAGMLTGCKEKEDETDKGAPIVTLHKPEGDNPYLTKTYADGSDCDEDFKIVTFTDTHLKGDSTSAGDAASLTLIENTIKTEKPDLIVFCGDNAVGPNAETAIRTLGALFERYNQYWGYVLGNHDGEDTNGPSRASLPAIYSEFSHCVVTPVEGISGDVNCIVNIKKASGEVIQSLVFIDSGNYLKEDFCEEYGYDYIEGEYDFIKHDQINWYKSEMRRIGETNGKMPSSIMFMHIPLKEYRTAYDEAKKAKTVIYGGWQEEECDSPYNTGMFEAILEIGSTKAVVCGHDHVNDYCVEYQGIKLLYSQSSSFNSYFMRKNPFFIATYQLSGKAPFNDGHTEFLINKSGQMTVTPRLNQNNPALFDGLTEEQRQELFINATLPKQA